MTEIVDSIINETLPFLNDNQKIKLNKYEKSSPSLKIQEVSLAERISIFAINIVILTGVFIAVVVAVNVYPYKAYYENLYGVKFNLFSIFISNLGNPLVLDPDVGFSYNYLIFNTAICIFGICLIFGMGAFFLRYSQKIRYPGFIFSFIGGFGICMISIFYMDLIPGCVHVLFTAIGLIGVGAVIIYLFILEIVDMYKTKKLIIFSVVKWVTFFAGLIIVAIISIFPPFVNKNKKIYGDDFQRKVIEWVMLPVLVYWLYMQSFSFLELPCTKYVKRKTLKVLNKEDKLNSTV